MCVRAGTPPHPPQTHGPPWFTAGPSYSSCYSLPDTQPKSKALFFRAGMSKRPSDKCSPLSTTRDTIRASDMGPLSPREPFLCLAKHVSGQGVETLTRMACEQLLGSRPACSPGRGQEMAGEPPRAWRAGVGGCSSQLRPGTDARSPFRRERGNVVSGAFWMLAEPPPAGD